MTAERDQISRLYLFVVATTLAVGAGYVYLKFGFGLGAAALATFAAIAFWGVVSASPKVSHFISNLFTSGL